MGRWAIVLAATLAMLGLPACGGGNEPTESSPAGSSDPTGASTNGSEGRIVFQRYDPSTDGPVTYTINPDGSDEQQLFSTGIRRILAGRPTAPRSTSSAAATGWSRISSIPARGGLRTLAPPDPALEIFCGGAWSPDGERLACEGFGVDDPSLTASTGSAPPMGAAWSGSRPTPAVTTSPATSRPMVSVSSSSRIVKNEPAGIFVTTSTARGSADLAGRTLSVDDTSRGSWSPDGRQILFVARETEDQHKAIWVVNADGSSPHQLRDRRACGGPLSDRGRWGATAELVAGRGEDRVRPVDPRTARQVRREHLHREHGREGLSR